MTGATGDERPIDLGEDCTVAPDVTVPGAGGDSIEGAGGERSPPRIGDGATLRAGTVLYPDVVAGPGLQTGHHAVIREETALGEDVLVGTRSVIDGRCAIDDGASLQTGTYVPPESDLGERVFLGPSATLTNDPYPLRRDEPLAGPTLADDVSVGANATILPDVTVGERSFVAAGAVVADDIPPETLAVGVPAVHRPLPERLEGPNGA